MPCRGEVQRSRWKFRNLASHDASRCTDYEYVMFRDQVYIPSKRACYMIVLTVGSVWFNMCSKSFHATRPDISHVVVSSWRLLSMNCCVLWPFGAKDTSWWYTRMFCHFLQRVLGKIQEVSSLVLSRRKRRLCTVGCSGHFLAYRGVSENISKMVVWAPQSWSNLYLNRGYLLREPSNGGSFSNRLVIVSGENHQVPLPRVQSELSAGNHWKHQLWSGWSWLFSAAPYMGGLPPVVFSHLTFMVLGLFMSVGKEPAKLRAYGTFFTPSLTLAVVNRTMWESSAPQRLVGMIRIEPSSQS